MENNTIKIKLENTFFIFTIYWFGCFNYVCSLSCGITMIVLNVSVWLPSTSTVLPDCGASSSKISPAPNFTNYFWYVWSVTALSLYTAQICFCIFTFLEIINHNMPKCVFSSIFSIKMTTQKFTILIFLNVCWYDSCHNTM